jgi:putative ABC transport system substrate-binding protein
MKHLRDMYRVHQSTNLARPGGNATGVNFFTAELAAKRLGLLRELLPAATRVAVLVNPADPIRLETIVGEVKTAAGAIGLQFQVVNASTSREIDAAFATLAAAPPDALFVGPDPFFYSRRGQLALQAARHALPASYAVRDSKAPSPLICRSSSQPSSSL